MKKKTPRGAGYTQRVSGRRLLTTQVLEDRLEQAKQELQQLQKQNEILRAKESMQMELLESCELGLGSMGGIPQQSPGAACNETLMTAALLDVQALQLKCELRPRPEPAPVKEALSALNSTFTWPAALAAGQGQQHPVSSSSESVSTSVSIGSTSSGGETSEDSSTCRTARVKRLLASLTPAEVNTFRALSLAQVAERIRLCVGRIALARQAEQRPRPSAAVDVQPAVDDFSRVCLLSLVSNEPRHCRLVGLNLETLEPAAPAQQLWASCVEKVDLRPQQKQQICTAYHIHSQQVASLLQQQQEVMQQLQSLLGTTGALELPPTSSEAAAAQTSPAAAAGTAAARPAHFMSLVAGTAEGSAEQHEAASPLGAVRASHAVVEAVSDGEARPGSLDAAAAAAGKSGGASSAAQLRRAAAAAAGSSCGSSTFLSSALLGDSYSRDSAAATQQPAAGLDPIQEASAGHGSSITDAGASMSSAGIGSSITSVGSSSGGNLQGPIGVLALEDAERVEQLLQELMRISLQLKQQGRSLSTLFMNMMTAEQSAECALAAYPYILNIPAFCACVAGAPLPQETRQG